MSDQVLRPEDEAAASSEPQISKPSVTVVVPVFNEEEYIRSALPKLIAELDDVWADIEILVVENGSDDATAQIVREMIVAHPNLKMLQLPEANYGAAIRKGFTAAEAEWVVVFDIDYFSGEFLSRALEQRDSADIVVGSKRVAGSVDNRGFIRRAATWQLNFILSKLPGLKVSDTHGMKAIRLKVLEAVLGNVVSTNDLFDTEVVLRAERAGFKIVELPVVVQEERESKTAIWKRIPRTIRGILEIRAAL